MKQSIKYTFFLLLIAGGLWGCAKDKVPTPTPLTKWEKIEGTYKVFDTIGIYLYTMEIKHIQNLNEYGYPIDSLEFVNFDNGFRFKTKQNTPTPSNWPDTYILINAPNPSQDGNEHSWQLYGYSNNFENNIWADDTIHLKFRKINILYYLQDMVPYSDSICKQVAVKQH